MGDASRPEPPPHALPWRGPLWLCLLGAFLVLVAVRWMWISQCGSQLPFWDEWKAYGNLLIHASQSRLTLGELFAPHNEHRLFWTALSELTAFWLNSGQWDAQALMTLNALLGAAVPILLWWALGGRDFPREFALPLAVGLALIWLCPVLWFNATWAFQNQFYFLILFSGGGMALLCRSPELSWKWWLGVALLFCGLLAMGSGVLAPLALLCVGGLRMIRARSWRAAGGWSLGAVAVVLLLGAALQLGAERDATLIASGAGDFAISLSKHLSWPWTQDYVNYQLVPGDLPKEPNRALWGLLLWLPAPLLLLRLILGRPASPGRGPEGWETLAALAFWVYGQFLVLAYARGLHGAPPAWRHYDLHVVGLAVNLAALLWHGKLGWPAWMMNASFALLQRQLELGGAAIYACVFLAGLGSLSEYASDQMTRRAQINAEQTRNVRKFMATEDPADLTGRPLFHVPYWEGKELAAFMNHPNLRHAMPSGVRRPLALKRTGGGFYQDELPPFIPPDPLRKSWSNWRGGRNDMEARHAPTHFPYLHFPFTGEFPEGGTFTVGIMRNQKYGPEHREGPPRWRGWGMGKLRRPGTSDSIYVRTSNQVKWVAFLEPVEVGRLTHWTGELRENSAWVLGLGAALLVIGSLRMRDPETKLPA